MLDILEDAEVRGKIYYYKRRQAKIIGVDGGNGRTFNEIAKVHIPRMVENVLG